MSIEFVVTVPRTEDYWRGIILFGRNVATYKFALGRALLDLQPNEGDLVTLTELAAPFSARVCEALKREDKQSTSPVSKFLSACRAANRGQITDEQLVVRTVSLGFNNVIDAFHKVGGEDVATRFFVDERRANKGIRITDAFSELMAGRHAINLPIETDARWRLVETAWGMGVQSTLLAVRHDPDLEDLFVLDRSNRRRSISGSRDALSGYQKGHCFYCFRPLSLGTGAPPDVDHFFPHVLKPLWPNRNLDGVWNLVLACRQCNRGAEGKFASAPALRLLMRLHTRNEFLIASHHPLRETLMQQTGGSPKARTEFLGECQRDAVTTLLHQWEPADELEALF